MPYADKIYFEKTSTFCSSEIKILIIGDTFTKPVKALTISAVVDLDITWGKSSPYFD